METSNNQTVNENIVDVPYVETVLQSEDQTLFIVQEKSWRMILQTGGYDLKTLKFAPYLDITYSKIDLTVDMGA